MDLEPNFTPVPDHLAALMRAAGRDPATVNDHTGDPWTDANVIRTQYRRMARLAPRRYQEATPGLSASLRWVEGVSGAARALQGVLAQPLVAHGPSLLILGPVGVGKTHEAYGALWALSVTGVRAVVNAVGTADLMAAMRPGGTPERFDAYARVPVLLLDDIGTAKASEWTEEVTYRLVNRRYEECLPTVVTSNVPTDRLGELLGARIAGRLSEMCEVVIMDGKNRRIR